MTEFNPEVEIACIKERLIAGSTALALQAREYERRLEDLNHAHAQAVSVQKTYVTRELHDSIYNELTAKIANLSEKTDQRFSRLETTINKSVGQNATIAATVAAIVGLMGLLLGLWRAYHG
jgi:biopolymer transport protein ExbB/TolQ